MKLHKSIGSKLFGFQSAKNRRSNRTVTLSRKRRLKIEPLERRLLLAVDFTKVGVLDSTVVAPDDATDAGDTIAYEFTVANTGDQALENVSIDDPGLTVEPQSVDLLPAGETAVFTATYVVTQDDLDAGVVENTATVLVDGQQDGDPVTATVQLEQVPSLLVDKFLDANDDADASGDISVGDQLTFGIEVTNDGNVTLENVSVDDVIVREGDDEVIDVSPVLDDQGTPDPDDDVNVGDTDMDGQLDPGETWAYEANYMVTDADSIVGQVFIENVAVATATDPNGEEIQSADGLALASGDGVGSPGYWKNHGDTWMDTNGDDEIDDQDQLVIGDWDGDGSPDGQGIVLTTTEALRILDASQSQKGGDKRVTLGRSLIAAWLNITVGGNNYAIGDIDVGAKIDEAIDWLLEFDVDGDGDPFTDDVKRKEVRQAWGDTGEALYEFLDEYNNTGLGIAADRDTGEVLFDPAVIDEVLENL